jgi:hypothetical protein
MLRQGFRRLFAQEPTLAPRELDLRSLEDRVLYSATPLAAEFLAAQGSEMRGRKDSRTRLVPCLRIRTQGVGRYPSVAKAEY